MERWRDVKAWTWLSFALRASGCFVALLKTLAIHAWKLSVSGLKGVWSIICSFEKSCETLFWSLGVCHIVLNAGSTSFQFSRLKAMPRSKFRAKISWKEAVLQLGEDWDVKRAAGSLSDAKQWRKAFEVLRHSATFRARLDSTLANSVANACNFKTGPWNKCLQLLYTLPLSGIKPDAFSSGIGAKSFGHLPFSARLWECALHFLLAYESCLGSLNPIVWGTILDVVGRASGWCTAAALLASMLSDAPRRPKPDTLCLNVVISGSQEAWATGLQLLSSSIRLDEVSFNSGMANLEGRNGRLVWKLFSQMRCRNIEPSRVTYGTAANVFASTSEWRSAFQSLYHGMWASTAPNIITFGACLNGCQKGGAWRNALQLVDEIYVSSLQLNAPCSGATLNSCGSCQEWSYTLKLLQWLRSIAMPLSLPMFGAAMAACEGAVDDPDIPRLAPALWEWTLGFFEMLKSENTKSSRLTGLTPDLVTIGIGASACGKGGKWPSCLRFIEISREYRIQPSTTLFNSVLDGLDRGRCWDQSLALLTLFQDQRFNLDSLSIRSLMQASEESSNHMQMLGSKGSACRLEKGTHRFLDRRVWYW